MKRRYITNNALQTRKIGAGLAKELLKLKPWKSAIVLALKGDLGGGKTTFLQGLAKGLQIKEKILSPTFVILKKFKFSSPSFRTFYHVDCYRVKSPKELVDLGLKEIIKNPENIVAIEWADKIKKIIPAGAIWIRFEFINENTRKITYRF